MVSKFFIEYLVLFIMEEFILQDSTNSVPIALRVVRDNKIVHQSVVSAGVSCCFLELLKAEIEITHDDEIDRIRAGSTFKPDDLFSVSPSTKIGDALLAIDNCTKIKCTLKPLIAEKTAPANAFNILMTQASNLVLPSMRQENNSRAVLHNRVVEYLAKKQVGFRVFERAEMDLYMNVIVATLWYIDGQWDKFSAAPKVKPLPPSLHLVPVGKSCYRVLHHGDHRKKSATTNEVWRTHQLPRAVVRTGFEALHKSCFIR